MDANEAIKKDFKAIISRCQTLNALVKRIGKLTESLTTAKTNDVRRRRYISIQVGLEKLALQEHELHCDMVNLGIADYSADRYGKITLKLQFGESVLYFREPSEESHIPIEKEKDFEQTSLEMAVEEAHRPEITGDESVDVTAKEELNGDQSEPLQESAEEDEDDGTWYNGDDLDTLQKYLSLHEDKFDRGEENLMAHFRQKIKLAKAKAGIPEPKPEKTKAPAEPKAKKPAEPAPEPPPAPVTMKLSEATKEWKKTGVVPEGFQLVGDNLYKKAAPKDPERHVKATPPAPPAETAKATKAKTPPPVETPAPVEPEEPKKPLVDGPFGEGAKPGKDLIW